MQIEPTKKCDLFCSYCPRKDISGKGEDLEFELFRKIIESNPFLSAILLQGLGEPLLNTRLEDMISYARSKGIFVGICTNGMSLSGDRIKSLLDSGLNYIAISVDGTGEAFESTRRGASFDRLVKGLSDLRQKGVGRCISAFWMTLRRNNLDQVIPVIDLAGKYGIEHVHFQDLQYKHAPDELRQLSISSITDLQRDRAILSFACKKAIHAGIAITFDPLDRHDNRTHCRWPWDGIYVDCSGNVEPCCVAWGDGFIMGNLAEERLSRIWRSESYRRFRMTLKRGPLPEICKECRFL